MKKLTIMLREVTWTLINLFLASPVFIRILFIPLWISYSLVAFIMSWTVFILRWWGVDYKIARAEDLKEQAEFINTKLNLTEGLL